MRFIYFHLFNIFASVIYSLQLNWYRRISSHVGVVDFVTALYHLLQVPTINNLMHISSFHSIEFYQPRLKYGFKIGA